MNIHNLMEYFDPVKLIISYQNIKQKQKTHTKLFVLISEWMFIKDKIYRYWVTKINSSDTHDICGVKDFSRQFARWKLFTFTLFFLLF